MYSFHSFYYDWLHQTKPKFSISLLTTQSLLRSESQAQHSIDKRRMKEQKTSPFFYFSLKLKYRYKKMRCIGLANLVARSLDLFSSFKLSQPFNLTTVKQKNRIKIYSNVQRIKIS
jgi:hypothetical protein